MKKSNTVESQDKLTTAGSRDTEVLTTAISNAEHWFEVAKEVIKDRDRLNVQLGIVIDILLRECPQYEGYVKANFPNYKRS